jgi:hypothetical protein
MRVIFFFTPLISTFSVISCSSIHVLVSQRGLERSITSCVISSYQSLNLSNTILPKTFLIPISFKFLRSSALLGDPARISAPLLIAFK